jgi:hypothetical protein
VSCEPDGHVNQTDTLARFGPVRTDNASAPDDDTAVADRSGCRRPDPGNRTLVQRTPEPISRASNPAEGVGLPFLITLIALLFFFAVDRMPSSSDT